MAAVAERFPIHPRPAIRSTGDQPAFWVAGDRYTLLLSAADTGGAFSLFEFRVPAGRGSPPHIHHGEHETFVVLEGELDFTVDGKTHRARPGTIVFGARDVVHNFRNVGSTEARMIVVCTPGGLERFFDAAGQPAGPPDVTPPMPTAADKARMIAVAPAHGVELRLPDH